MLKQRKEPLVHQSIIEMILTICFEEYKHKFNSRLSLLDYHLHTLNKNGLSSVHLYLVVAVPFANSLLSKCEELQRIVKREFELLAKLKIETVTIYIKKITAHP